MLDVVLEGSKRAVRMRTEGRSSARGPLPAWIEAAVEYSVELKPGSTVLELQVPTLLEAAPATFQQSDFFRDIDPERSSFDYFSDSLVAAAVEGDEASHLFDKGLLKVFRGLEAAFDAGAEAIAVEDEVPVRIKREDIQRLAQIESDIPDPQYVRVAGKLDTIRHSDRTFTILTTELEQSVKGIAAAGQQNELQALWGKRVVVTGIAHFTANGQVLRIDADRVRQASESEMTLWGRLPRPFGRLQVVAEARKEQGPRSGLNAIVGHWPGEESDADISTALEEIS